MWNRRLRRAPAGPGRRLQGLGRLEYRGYDSAGVAVLDGAGGLAVQRKVGLLVNLVSWLTAAGRDGLCRRLEGAFTLVVTHADEPDLVVAARRSSPLVVGVGKGEHFVASDVAAFIEHTREAVELGQDQVVTIIWEGYEVTDFAGADTATRFFHVDWDLSAAEKGGHDYFMLKEIQEQPGAVADTLRERRPPAAAGGRRSPSSHPHPVRAMN